MEENWAEIEQPAGPPLVPPVDPAAVDEHRRRVYQSYEAFLRNRLAELNRERPQRWQRDYSSLEAYLRSMEPMRERLKQMLGFWIEPEQRPPLRIEDPEILMEGDGFTARRFRLEVCPGLETYAVELIPHVPGPCPGLLAQHGYSGTPELICGLTASANAEDYAYRSLGLRAVRRGFHVVAVHHPTGYGTLHDVIDTPLPGFPNYPRTYGKNRLHRLAIMAGGALFGLDMLASSRGVDVLAASDHVAPDRIGMYGLSQGGQSAIFLPAMDVRIQASVASAYFNSRFVKLIGPHRALTFLDSTEEDKFFPEVIRFFSDSDLVSLIAPRAFAVEAGLKDSSVDFEKTQEQFAQARLHYERLGLPHRTEYIPHQEGHVSATRRAFDFLEEHLSSSTQTESPLPQRRERGMGGEGLSPLPTRGSEG
ncbi:MAG TPA: alpha/beta hydrolase family protein [Chthonomonadaceae bacterium]|nr:alpha/beta hydrolase family protein [Chthonomonadaceae bacterium]